MRKLKILIENVSMYPLPNKQFIEKGFIYLDKGVITSINPGDPPPELEFAEYVIDGRYSIVLPGFALGIGDILKYVFRFKKNSKLDDILSMLSLSELEILVATNLASIMLNGATSIVTATKFLDPRIVSTLARAASECWIRSRIVIPANNIDESFVEELVKTVLKSVKDQNAVNKNLITFGFYLDNEKSKISTEIIKTYNIKLYINQNLLRSIDLHGIEENSIIVQTQNDLNLVNSITKKVITFNPSLWQLGAGLVSLNHHHLNPKAFITSINKIIENSIATLDTMCHYNPLNLDIGIHTLENGKTVDIIILDFSKPPTGPIPVTNENVAIELASANYLVDTVIIGGELVVDQGFILTIGDKHVKKTRSIIESIILNK